jgi:hypothetical protein
VDAIRSECGWCVPDPRFRRRCCIALRTLLCCIALRRRTNTTKNPTPPLQKQASGRASPSLSTQTAPPRRCPSATSPRPFASGASRCLTGSRSAARRRAMEGARARGSSSSSGSLCCFRVTPGGLVVSQHRLCRLPAAAIQVDCSAHLTTSRPTTPRPPPPENRQVHPPPPDAHRRLRGRRRRLHRGRHHHRHGPNLGRLKPRGAGRAPARLVHRRPVGL